MPRSSACLLILSLAVAACGPATTQPPGDTPSAIGTETAASTPAAIATATPAPTVVSDDAPDQSGTSAHVWYLGANGWAVKIGQKLLIFDYQEQTDPSPPAPGQARNLDRGYVNPDELRAFDAYVFVTHQHFDHYDQVIFDWAQQVESVTYLFGWQAGREPEHYYFADQRAHADVDGMEVYTIYSHHSGVPEVAFLVKLDEYTIYHNGDYKAQYVDDYAYLRTIADHIDIAFVIGHPVADHQYFQQARLLDELFHATYVFPMNREGEAFRCQEFAELLAGQGVRATPIVAEKRGDSFACPKNATE